MGIDIDVEKENKIKFKAQGATILLKKKPNATYYSMTIKLLNLIPIKAKDMAVKFTKVGNDVFFKMLDPTNGERGLYGSQNKT